MITKKGFTTLEMLLVLIILVVIGWISYDVHHSQQAAEKTLNATQAESNSTPKYSSTIKTFIDCEAASGSITQETFPEICVSNDGGKFIESPKYDDSVCNAKIHDDAVEAVKASFVSYDSQNNQISYKPASANETVSNGWCTVPKVEDKNKNAIKLSDLKAGDSITLAIAWDGIETIQKN